MRRVRECGDPKIGSVYGAEPASLYLADLVPTFLPITARLQQERAVSNEAKIRIQHELEAVAALTSGEERLTRLKAIRLNGLVGPDLGMFRQKVQIARDAAEDEKQVDEQTRQSSERLAAAQAEVARQRQANQAAQDEAQRQRDLTDQANQSRRLAEERKVKATAQIAEQEAEMKRLQEESASLNQRLTDKNAAAAEQAATATRAQE